MIANKKIFVKSWNVFTTPLELILSKTPGRSAGARIPFPQEEKPRQSEAFLLIFGTFF